MTDIKSLNYDELVTYMAGLGEKKFRASHQPFQCIKAEVKGNIRICMLRACQGTAFQA